MKRSFPLVLGLALVAISANSSLAQRGRSGAVSTPYGSFSAAEMAQAGGDPTAALQMREQKQYMQEQQQMFKQQQAYMQQLAKQQDFLKKHPEVAKSLAQPPRVAKKAPAKASKKAKSLVPDAAASKTDKPSAIDPVASKTKKAG